MPSPRLVRCSSTAATQAREHLQAGVAVGGREAGVVFEGDRRVFVVLRAAAADSAWAICLHNVTGENVTVKLTATDLAEAEVWTEMISERPYPVSASGTLSVPLRPYEVNWLSAQRPHPQLSVAVA